MTEQHVDVKKQAHNGYSSALREEIRSNVQACMQCGTCTGSCANTFAMDMTPRQMWRLAQLGRFETILKSKTFFLCSACYYCTLRCPRGLPLTETINGLKRLAAAEGIKDFRQSSNFYRTFMDTVRRYGRSREMEFMNRYFLSMKNPFFPLGFASMGLKLMKKGKIPIEMPKLFGKGRFDRLFSRVQELEEKP